MKPKSRFTCQQCGQVYSKWSGKCAECGQWNTIIEEEIRSSSAQQGETLLENLASLQTLSEISHFEVARYLTSFSEWDRVLGGGLVPGSVNLLGGEPGIGKSTLLLQVSKLYADLGLKVLYFSGEESVHQISSRAKRLGLEKTQVLLASENNLEKVLAYCEKESPNLLIIDSVQTLSSRDILSHPGSVSQIRECTYEIVEFSKQKNVSTFLVGHITKEGQLAGPKLLEHMVDSVLNFETSSSQFFRLLRATKNRFGSTNELGVFEMTHQGLKSIENPSQLLLSDRNQTIPGSVITATIEGNRPLLVEVQALVTKSYLAIPRRTSLGIDANRLALLVAILEKRVGFRFFDQDIFLNIVGGLSLKEPAADLSIAASLISSYQNKPIAKENVYTGEIGLGGEIRSVPFLSVRLQEAERLGFETVIIPKKQKGEIQDSFKQLKIIPVQQVQDILDIF